MKTFQVAILLIFGFFIVAGVAVVATFGRFGGGGGEDVPAVATIWGTLDAAVVTNVITTYNQENDNVLQVTYEQFPEATFDTELIEALAAQRGPDAIILPHEYIPRYEDKIYTIPFETLTERTFRDTYIEGAEVYLTNTGAVALPILVDPLVMYWNRTLLNAATIAQPPRVWEDLLQYSAALTETDASFNVLQSTVALGEFANVAHAKEILATLVMQAGNPLIVRDADGGATVMLSDRLGFTEAPADSALRFYTEFANPVKPVYSWNRSLPRSTDFFLSGDLAFYLGFASELFDLQEKNPNLNFDVARIPQIEEGVLKTTFGKFYGIALMRQSDNVAGAFSAASLLAGADAGALWSEAFSLPPARRDLLSVVPTDVFTTVFFSEAIIAHAFLDPNPAESSRIFETMVTDVTSGRQSVNQAVSTANQRLQALFE